jgi:hypothetical protein
MPAIVVPAAAREPRSAQASPQGHEARADRIVIPIPRREAGCTNFNITSAVLSVRRSIAASALALASRAETTMLHLLR